VLARRTLPVLQCLVIAAKDDAARKEQLVLINTRLLALCTAHDSVAADEDKLAAAAEVYRDLLSSVRSDGGRGRRAACAARGMGAACMAQAPAVPQHVAALPHSLC
jgi:hypothetical protein